MSTTAFDRAAAIRAQALTTGINGIDFIEVVNPDVQTTLNVHFINTPSTALMALTQATQPGQAGITVSITGGESIPTVAVIGFTWTPAVPPADGATVLQLTVAEPGDFSSYTLALDISPPSTPPLLDPFLNQSVFSFKAGCCSTVDCEPPSSPCPPPTPNAPPIEYLAKDYQSFRQALLDFSSLRYPAWQERTEGDFGVMFAEALSSIADDFSYLQDRIAAEATIGTATERRSLVRLARLMNYEPAPATAAQVLLQLYLATGTGGLVPAGVNAVLLNTQGPDGTLLPFETGNGLADTSTYPVQASWNAIQPYIWDQSVSCLLVGATSMWVAGAALGLTAGQQILIDTAPLVPGNPHVRELATLAADEVDLVDPLVSGGAPVAYLTFQAPLAQHHDLTTPQPPEVPVAWTASRTTISANLVPATQGMRVPAPQNPPTLETFGIGSAPAGGLQAIERTGPNGTTQYLYTLASTPLAWLPQAGAPSPLPEILLTGPIPGVPGSVSGQWSFCPSLVLADAGPSDPSFTIDPMLYVQLGMLSDGSTAYDYDSDAGDTIRFGDSTFGAVPDPTAVSGVPFGVVYRVGGGAAGNVAAGATFTVTPAGLLALGAVGISVDTVTNPFAATGGNDPESAESIQRRAPYAFRNNLARAPLAADFETYAEQLPWVNRADTMFRWTGSWLTAFTAPDPVGTQTLSVQNEIQLLQTLDRVRMAGRDSQVIPPLYAPLDLVVVVCAQADAYRADVASALLAALGSGVLPGGTNAFFHPNNFTFGQALRRSTLEAAVQAVAGVGGVQGIAYRMRGVMSGFAAMPATVTVAGWQIIQVDSDPSRPAHGTVQVSVEGGK